MKKLCCWCLPTPSGYRLPPWHSRGEVQEAVDSVLKEYNIHPKAIKQVTSIDIKSNEEGLLEFLQRA